MSEDLPDDGDWQPDAVTRLNALAAALPGSVVAQRIVEPPFEDVWAVMADLERSVPIYETQVQRLQVVRRAGEHLDLDVELVDGRRQDFQARLSEGWCLMQSDDSVVAMAARPAGARTLVAHLEHARQGTNPALVRVGRLGAVAEHQAKLLAEIAVIERLSLDRPSG
jgi:hypothetical protein